ncbi:hemicentin-1-like [Zerene cesonia]|uniref:hemicentin-1-like n=1 Tax=Zerene cesonia TaxID=33412 RepID=UPI0018E53660|nr:hemicentin-1-like [Zerene cesonia]
MRDVTLSLSGRSPELKVYHVDGTEMMLTLLVKTENVYIAKLTSVAPGDYIAKVSVMPGDADLMIKGACSTSIRHGFSPFLPTSMKDTILNPSLGDKSLLAIELLNEDNLSDVNLLGVQIYDITGNPVMNLTLNIVNAKEKLYVSDEFIPPDKPFRIAIIGAAEDCAKKEVIRVTNPTIEPMPKGFAVFNQAPTIQKLEILTSDKDKVAILCKAGGYPKPEIIWKDKNGVTFSNATIADDDLSRPEISSTLTIIDPEDNLFTCMATNAHGSDSDFVPIKLPKEPVIDKSVKKINKNKGEEVDIFCSLKQGNPKPEISWYFMGEAENEYVKLNETSESLHISSLGIDNSGSYHCKANNSEGSDSYTMDLFVPDVRDKTVNANAGELITLDCASGGISQPAVHWFINYREVFNGGRYIIHNNHSLSFKTNDFDSGRYECVSINRNQRKRKIIFEVEINPDFGFRVTRI